MITQDELQQALYFNPRTGVFRWKFKRPGRCRGVGNVAGSKRVNGYISISINGSSFYAHRLAWLWVYGFMPRYLDHVDGNKENNAINNLRIASKSQNGFNRGKAGHNTSGYKGVYWDGRSKAWFGKFVVLGTQITTGYFKSKKSAAEAYDDAVVKYHGEFALTNRMLGLLEKSDAHNRP